MRALVPFHFDAHRVPNTKKGEVVRKILDDCRKYRHTKLKFSSADVTKITHSGTIQSLFDEQKNNLDTLNLFCCVSY